MDLAVHQRMAEAVWVTVLFWVALLVLVGVVARLIIQRRAGRNLHETPYESSSDLDILSEQFREGDISREEFDVRLKDIRSRKKNAA